MESTFLGPLLKPNNYLADGRQNIPYSSQICWNQPTFHSVLLCGPRNSGKTSLLFELAFTFAEQDLPVLFISPREIENLPCYVGDRMHPREGALKIIEMTYPTTKAELLSVLSSVHLRPSLKRLSFVIIDDIHSYFNGKGNNEIAAQIARVCCYAVDAVNFLDSKRSQHTPHGCALIASLSITDEVAFFQQKHVLERWFPNIIRAHEVQNVLGEVNDGRQYKLTNSKCHLSSSMERNPLNRLFTSSDTNKQLTYKFDKDRIQFSS